MYKIFRQLERGEHIVVGVDTSAGGTDYTAGQFLSKTKLDVPIVYHSRITTSEFTNTLPRSLEQIYEMTGVRPVVAYERQGGGVFELDRLAGMNRANKYEVFKMPTLGRQDAPEAVKYGWDTTSATRPSMLQDLKEAIDKRVLRLYDEVTITELYSFVIVNTTSSWKAQAERGAHDDLVMSLAVALQVHQQVRLETMDALKIEFPKGDLFRRGGFY